ncbi:PVC-type heme-binding CxxCH protein [Planctomicrobium piriforme]|uniref:Putative membrane-bound dehydrogenase domain-containing protein n=1 Tax=Planctomicrobium piriforme TaxID=1576369 RepID=A0A1I3E3P3_9PLAN|nr:PVC-type heme-binding CxxCH protein [Planctomicrobium piriforme]SFH93423.1 putative membrane-bound dehydrogenase domain-containing protein [Planctomicrobium piriforme]
MRLSFVVCVASALMTSLLLADEPATGFKPIFDGQTLNGWRGKEGFWRVENGAIVGETTPEKPLDKNTFLVWDNGTVDNFELRLKFRISGSEKANSGIQFRCTQREDGHVVGYQADIDRAGQWVGALYDEAARGILAKRGQKTTITADGKLQTENVADPAELLKKFQVDGWNDYSVSAVGNHITLKINGAVMCEVIDNDPKGLDRSGILALQLHVGPPMKIEFKDILLKRLPMEEGFKKVVFVAGKPSHGYFSHEHNAGCLLLKKALDNSGLPLVTAAYLNGWPKDVTAFDNADTVVAYCDGGGNHFLNPHLPEFDELVQQRGVGLVCLHYGVETTKGDAGNHFLKWIGGYFEPDWSVNPHWTANFESLPKHPITQGVQPFEINDEWYYHMRFVPDMKGVTPILTALPPNETLTRKDGPHSGNPFVRAAVLERHEPQHMAWAYERPEKKGRGFGFTGGHFHANWQQDDFRKLVLNAIVWSANAKVPDSGVVSPTPTVQEMEANQDEPRPDNFQFKSPGKAKSVTQAPAAGSPPIADAKPAYSSPVVWKETPGYGVDIAANIAGAKSLFLVVSGANDGIGCDWADWEEPRLTGAPNQPDLKLTDLKWKSANCGSGEVQVNKNCEGHPLLSNGKQLAYGIGTHSNSVIEYELPAGHAYTQFKARGVIDEGGTRQGCGSTVQFYVFAEQPGSAFLKKVNGESAVASHESTAAVEQLDVHPELKATLFASEPMMSNPTSIDIDHLGRVWVCEGVNYRAFRNEDVIGKDHAPDRILILEDTDGNAVADKSTVFYQGRDVDSAQGILVLPTPDGKGTRALVSSGDSIFYLIDDDGDMKADRKELLFTGISGTQHDHGIHACHFGPDGKLYFNFGNAGGQVKDKNGKPIIDKSGHEVNSSRNPYQEGMIFRCNLDGSEFETLAWNFRNNWEVCVDSFGTMWQSDNDDDGNRGVRINYVMEYGNYGYKDEITGAGWQSPRTNWEAEIPLRHWHLNDPGVMPNMLQTGAGAPTGICLYEGNLLPAKLRGAVIHCDAGPNICRAYIPKVDGAGYKAEVVDLLSGARNKWFRPSDVCVAPDGSLLVADWYDPGVGGHRMQDVEHGRIFRLAPPSAPKYNAPKVDVSTPEAAAQALQSPNMATRYLAWTALEKMGPAAEPVLVKMFKGADPVMQARALWLLGKLNLDHAKMLEHLRAGMASLNPDIRIAAVRLFRQKLKDVSFADIVGAIHGDDSSEGVRREILIALREVPSNWYPADNREDFPAGAWMAMARQYDGNDRWYLEALGIAAEGKWDENLKVWMEAVGEEWKTTKAGRDIIWRSRGEETPQLLVQLINSAATPAEEIPRYLRALDFQLGASKQSAVNVLAFSSGSGDPERTALVRAEALARLSGNELSSDPKQKAALEQVLRENQGTERFVMLVNRFNLKDHYPELLAMAQAKPESQVAVDAVKVLLDKKQDALLQKVLTGDNREQAEKTFAAVATAGDKRTIPMLQAVLKDDSKQLWARQAAVKAMGSSQPGAQALIELAQRDAVPASLKPAVAAVLSSSSNPGIRAIALKLFPAPPGKNSAPLPSIPELADRSGNADQGKIVFNTVGTCNKCHQVNGIGVEVGPNLSEIGKKLARPAMFESILYPSAAISHGFENWLILGSDGQVYTGLLVSETDQEVKLKDDKGIIRTIQVKDIDERKKQDISLMPADLQKLMTTEELVDLVEYLMALKERRM